MRVEPASSCHQAAMASPGRKSFGFRPDLVSLCAWGQAPSRLWPVCPHLQSGEGHRGHTTVSGSSLSEARMGGHLQELYQKPSRTAQKEDPLIHPPIHSLTLTLLTKSETRASVAFPSSEGRVTVTTSARVRDRAGQKAVRLWRN